MGFFKKIVNGVYKFTFGIDLNKQQKYIDTLESQVEKLKKSNIQLKAKVNSQKLLLEECNENLRRILEPMNKLITFKIYFGVESNFNKKGTSTSNFELTFRGIFPLHYNSSMIADHFNNTNRVKAILHLFDIHNLDHNTIVGVNKGGYDDRMIEDEPTEYIDVGLTIDNKEVTYPSNKLDNDWRV